MLRPFVRERPFQPSTGRIKKGVKWTIQASTGRIKKDVKWAIQAGSTEKRGEKRRVCTMHSGTSTVHTLQKMDRSFPGWSFSYKRLYSLLFNNRPVLITDLYGKLPEN